MWGWKRSPSNGPSTVFREDTGLRLTNGSIIRRVWENLAEYHTEVLLDIAVDEGYEEYEATAEVLEPVLADLDLSTPAKRLAATAEVCRVGGGATMAHNRSPAWSLWIGVWGPGHRRQRHRAEGQDPPGALGQLRHEQRGASTRRHTACSPTSSACGCVRVALPCTEITVATGALAEGCALRHRVDGDMQEFGAPDRTGRRGPGVDPVRAGPAPCCRSGSSNSIRAGPPDYRRFNKFYLKTL